jgi:predicted dehydrogenase
MFDLGLDAVVVTTPPETHDAIARSASSKGWSASSRSRSPALHFLEFIRERAGPLTDGRKGLRVVQVIEAAQDSLRHGGDPVRITDGRSYDSAFGDAAMSEAVA